MSRKNARSRKLVASASTPVTDPPAVPAPVVLPAASLAPADVTLLAPSPAAPVPTPTRTRRDIGRLCAADSTERVAPPPVTGITLASRFAPFHPETNPGGLNLDPTPVMFCGAFLNVAPVTQRFSGPLADPNGTGLTSVPVPPAARADALRHALTLARYAATGTRTAAPVAPAPLLNGIAALYAHNRAERSRSGALLRPDTFDRNRVSPLDMRASLARAACFLARIDPDGLGSNDACDATIPGIVAHLAARVAALDATPTPAAPSAPAPSATPPTVHHHS